MRQPGEPSVEEILESIKLVIARDNAPVGDRRRRDADDDVLDLGKAGEIVEDDDVAARPAPGFGPLLNETTREAMRSSFAALSMLADPAAAQPGPRGTDTSLEAMVREMLRPALATWLDRNLPPIVERMVAAEIARIMSQGR